MNVAETAPQSQNHVLQASSSSPGQKFNHQKTLLLAEDDDDLRLVMECSLASMGYVVVACADALLAAAAFHTYRFDALVTDFDMPGRTGLELARELTTFQPRLPVLVITGTIFSADMLQELADRRWVYMCKPSNLFLVESVLKQMVTVDQSTLV